jgi:hypothetical protein
VQCEEFAGDRADDERDISPAKTNGAAQFSIDVNLPGMKVALVARPIAFALSDQLSIKQNILGLHGTLHWDLQGS